MYFMAKFDIGLSYVLAYLLWSFIEPANGSNNYCLGCSHVFDQCTGHTNSLLASKYDANLIKRREPNDGSDTMVSHCVPITHKIIGELEDFVCFQQPRCYVVVGRKKYEEVIHSPSVEKDLCTKCGTFCGCHDADLTVWLKRAAGASTSLNIGAFKWVIFIGIFTFLANMT